MNISAIRSLLLALFVAGCASSRPPEVVHMAREHTFTTCDVELVRSANRAMTQWECTPVHFVGE